MYTDPATILKRLSLGMPVKKKKKVCKSSCFPMPMLPYATAILGNCCEVYRDTDTSSCVYPLQQLTSSSC